jgi:hypothetical protein
VTPTNIPVNTDVTWWISILVEDVNGDNIDVLADAVVKDRLGGDLELLDSNCTDGTVDTSKVKGKTKKQFITWNIGDVADANSAELILEISTDVNPGQSKKASPKNEYTSPGTHCINSGAVLKFIDEDGTGLQLSAHTPPICVEAFIPEQ